MRKQSLGCVVQHIRKLAAVSAAGGLADHELLERFVETKDETAFAVLFKRHGPMVLGVCRRILEELHDAEDACQVAFLVLARRAASIRKTTSLSSWLHGVARHVAANLKREQARRQRRERNNAKRGPSDLAAELTLREAQTILDEEIQHLPERLRAPLILCYLDGRTRDEAAQQLGVSVSCLHGRLERGREVMRNRLTRRGLTLSAALLATTFGDGGLRAAVSSTMVLSTAEVAVQFASGGTLSETLLSKELLSLTQEVLRNMLLAKLKFVLSAIVGVGALVTAIGGSAVLVAAGSGASPPAKSETGTQAVVRRADDLKEPAKKEVPEEARKAEPIKYTGRVFDKDSDKAIAGATVTVRRTTYGDPKGEKILEETKHTTDAEGKYNFAIPPAQAAERYLYIELDVEAPGYAPRSNFGYSFAMIQKNEKLGGRPFFENTDLRPAKEISGLVETPEGKPAAGIKVLAYSNTTTGGKAFEYGSFANSRTDDQGRFHVWVTTPGPAVFWLLPEKYAPSTHVLKDPTKRGDLGRFILSPGVVLKGKVLDTSGQPVPGVYVNANKRGGIEDFNLPVGDHISRTVLTNDQGEFEFGPLPPGSYEVMPTEHGHDPTKDERRPPKRPLPNLVFVRQPVTLTDGQQPESIEVRAAPHVVIEAQYVDSKGKPSRGHEGHIFGRMNKNEPWFGQGKVDVNGKMTFLAPHGLAQVRLNLSTNEHGALRYRLKKDAPLSNAHDIDLGTLNDDVKGIEIVRYVAPILLVNGVDASGAQVKDFQIKVEYAPGKSPKQPNSSFVNGVQGDVYFEKQEDGRWRSSQLLPEEEITVTVSAEGYKPYQEKMSLAEGTTKELAAKLEKN